MTTVTPDYFIRQHYAARRSPRGIEIPIVGIVDSIDGYCKHYYGHVGNDGVLGEAVLHLAKALVELLDGELGRLDGGLLIAEVRSILEANGFTAEEIDSCL